MGLVEMSDESIHEVSTEAVLERMAFPSRMISARTVVKDLQSPIREEDFRKWCRDEADFIASEFDRSMEVSSSGDDETAEDIAEAASRRRLDGFDALSEFVRDCPGYLDDATAWYLVDCGYMREFEAANLLGHSPVEVLSDTEEQDFTV